MPKYYTPLFYGWEDDNPKEDISHYLKHLGETCSRFIHPMHPTPPTRHDPDWYDQPEPPTWSQPDPRRIPVVQLIERRSTVSTMPDDRVPNNEIVAQIMAERGVGRRYAYHLARREAAASVNTEGITKGQRLAALSALVEEPELGKSSNTLRDGLHARGVGLDLHDTVKTLWALQKTRLVRFRERNNPRSLYAIRVTDEGLAAYAQAKANGVDDNELLPTDAGTMSTVEEVITNVGPDQQADAYDLVEEHVKRVAENARLLQEEINAMYAGPKPGNSGPGSDEDWGPSVPQGTPDLGETDPPTVVLPWFKGVLGGYPVIRDLRDRAVRAAKLNAAAKILEEVGEDDMVLALMTKTEFNGLESEVITLLRHFGEIE